MAKLPLPHKLEDPNQWQVGLVNPTAFKHPALVRTPWDVLESNVYSLSPSCQDKVAWKWLNEAKKAKTSLAPSRADKESHHLHSYQKIIQNFWSPPVKLMSTAFGIVYLSTCNSVTVLAQLKGTEVVLINSTLLCMSFLGILCICWYGHCPKPFFFNKQQKIVRKLHNHFTKYQ